MDNQNTYIIRIICDYISVLILVLMDNQNTFALVAIAINAQSLNPCSNG